MKRPDDFDFHAHWIARGWKQESCGACGGHGVVDRGYLEVCPGECDRCCGSGLAWRSPKGHYALYPGGPFTG